MSQSFTGCSMVALGALGAPTPAGVAHLTTWPART